ncbi:MAG TPA: GYD domain-containing protein [Gemmatimonadales bacterium]|nr:GYD domain-containing protein [Gemmatimonadales bacterium]
MPKFMIQASYTQAGLKGLIADGGTKRRAAIEKLLGSVGGKLESAYFAFGETDVFIVADIPDNVSAAALSMTVNASGAAKCNATILLTPEEVDAATKKSVKYSAPGQ